MFLKSVLLISIILGMIFSVYMYDTKWKRLSVALLPIYLYCIYLFTASGRIGLLDIREMNLIPGGSIFIIWSSPWNNRGMYEFIEAVGNILMFVPLGMILRKYLKCNYWILSIIAISTSLVIEYMQYYLLIGTFEIDDIINNTWGALLGANIVYALKCVKERRLKLRNKVHEWIEVLLFLIFIIYAFVMFVRFIIT